MEQLQYKLMILQNVMHYWRLNRFAAILLSLMHNLPVIRFCVWREFFIPPFAKGMGFKKILYDSSPSANSAYLDNDYSYDILQLFSLERVQKGEDDEKKCSKLDKAVSMHKWTKERRNKAVCYQFVLFHLISSHDEIKTES